MRCYFILCENNIFSGGRQECLEFALQQSMITDSPIKVLTGRPEAENAKIIAEAFGGEVKWVTNNRCYPLKRLRKQSEQIRKTI